MTKLEELMQKYCSNGVEYKTLEDITILRAGDRIIKSMMNDNFEYPVMGGGYQPTGRYDKYNCEKSITISRAGSAGFVNWVEGKFWATDVCFIASQKNEKYDIKYIYYFVKNKQSELQTKIYGGNLPKLDKNYLWSLQIPVPPLEVQREIVRALDSFTFLSAELSAELQARKKQYEYYRDELLKPQDTIPMVSLKDISVSIYRGSGIKRDEVTETGIPCVRYGEIYTKYNTWFDECVSHTKEEYVSSPKYFEHGDILFAITGESVEEIAKSVAYVGHEKCLAGGDIVVMKHNQNPRYLAHVLNTAFVRDQKSKGKVKSKVVHSNVPSIEQIKIPLPSLEVQERYANVLDNFESICNDLNIGLPAEIEARQKQYEYYRDMLLTFAETGDIMPQTDRQTDRQTDKQ